MSKKKIISIWGNPNSGKTTFSLKLAKKLSKKKKNVILILADYNTPTLSVVMPQIDAGEKSLGALLEAPIITQESILKNCISTEKNEYLSVISYLYGENERTYAKYSKERVVDFFILLKHIADYVIIDCCSNISHDILSKSALELSDKAVRLITPDLRAVSFYASTLPQLAQRKYNLQNHIQVLSNIKENMPKDYVANRFGGISLELPHTEEIENQYIEARLLETLSQKKSQKYLQSLNEIVDIFYGEDGVNAEPVASDTDNSHKSRKSIFKSTAATKSSTGYAKKFPRNVLSFLTQLFGEVLAKIKNLTKKRGAK
ncbi:MAG: MinD/ParA family protein [Alkaliphilus sp.]